ncbi:MAG: UDP-N-acetylglucosamine 1-carboxyvinyltransferase [Armatimonadetes bacterium]|nr:UDP-N-acetylglucosamine 1-carboxyvinyltransferase [Armatimonadota bacterium]
MDTIHITGGQPLVGEVRISGSKNGALPLLAASLLIEGETVIENVPDIQDIHTMIETLRSLGAKCTYSAPGTLHVDATHISSFAPPYHLVRRMRGSFYVAGPLLSRFREAEVPLPGGCAIGPRPVDFHISGFKQLGAEVQERHGVMHARASRLRGTDIFLDGRLRSVGATINIMLAAVLAEGTTVIENASREPEVVSCENFLRSCGADITGVGTSRLVIKGVPRLHPSSVRAIPDRMETGTFLVAGLVTRGDITVTDIRADHMDIVVRELVRAGAHIDRTEDTLRVRMRMRPNPIEISTGPYPGFPTDLQPNMAVVAAVATGTSVIEETIFDSRFTYADELTRMGADIQVKEHVAIVRGVERLSGAPVVAMDLRAGSALALAGLAAEGRTSISGAEVLDRGYETFTAKLSSLGAIVTREHHGTEAGVATC